MSRLPMSVTIAGRCFTMAIDVSNLLDQLENWADFLGRGCNCEGCMTMMKILKDEGVLDG